MLLIAYKSCNIIYLVSLSRFRKIQLSVNGYTVRELLFSGSFAGKGDKVASVIEGDPTLGLFTGHWS